MPLHGYTTDNRPPTNLDHLLAHPYAIGLSVWQALVGLGVITAAITGHQLSESESYLHPAFLAAIGAFLIYGGVGVIRGLLNDDDDLRVGFRIERGGLILTASAWLAFAVALASTNPSGVYAYSFGATVTGVCLFRLWAGKREENRIATAVEQHTAT